MATIEPAYVVAILILVAIGFGATLWIIHQRRGVNRDGAVKGDARNASEVRRENPPDPGRR
jgi:hypothetical protein